MLQIAWDTLKKTCIRIILKPVLADVSIAKLLLLVLSYTVIVLYVIVLSLCVRLARCNKININTSIVTIEKAVCNGYVSPS